LDERIANQLLSDYFNKDISGNQFLLSCLQGNYSPLQSYNEQSIFLASNPNPFKNVRSGEKNLGILLEGAPLLKYTVQPFLKLLSNKAGSLSELDSEKLGEMISIYSDVFKLTRNKLALLDSTKSDSTINGRIAAEIMSALSSNGFFEKNSYAATTLPNSSLDIIPISNPGNGSLFFTTSQAEADILTSGGLLKALPKHLPYFNYMTGLPVYRLVNNLNSDHLFTINKQEKDYLLSQPNSQWKLEAIPFFAGSSISAGIQPIYRYFNPTLGQHYYLTQANASSNLPLGTIYEGFAFSG
jgi:hypothetical protein